MTRFDGREHLDRWRDTGQFPRIHDGIYNLVRSVLPKWATVCDLGSSTGLLTRRLHEAGYEVYGIEADHKALGVSEEYGVYLPEAPVHPFRVLRGTLEQYAGILTTPPMTDAVVARRVLPELLDHGVTPAMLGATLRSAGVRWLFLEGRAPRKGATHELASLKGEVDGLKNVGWRVAERVGDALAVMVPTG